MIAKAASYQPSAPNLTDQLPSRDIVWAALERVAGKQKNPDQIAEGSKHVLNFDVQGLIDGQLFRQTIDTIVTVGHGQSRASSVTPGLAEVVAYVLSKLNHATRHRILTDVPLEFAVNDCRLPEVDEQIKAQSVEFLKQLRRSRQVRARGALRCEFMMTD